MAFCKIMAVSSVGWHQKCMFHYQMNRKPTKTVYKKKLKGKSENTRDTSKRQHCQRSTRLAMMKAVHN